jgi:two-component system, chemotaxis family, protein-glutamate methylesterase/glutaminase
VTNQWDRLDVQQSAIQAQATHHDLIVVGTSSGGVEALQLLVRELPADLPAALLIVLHISPESPMLLADILNRAGNLPSQYAQDGEQIRYGHVYLAPPDRHLVVEEGRMRLTRGPKENRARPSVDPLFRSAAASYGPRTIGVILTGNLNDGSAGLWSVKQAGGVAVVQDPTDILYPGMPQSALAAVEVDYVRRLAEIPELLTQLVAQTVAGEENLLPFAAEKEVAMEINADRERQRFETLGERSGFSCPECGGVLNELAQDNVLRFRCHVGHAYTAEALEVELKDGVEQALWVALRTLEEKMDLHQRMAALAAERGHNLTVKQWQAEIAEMEERVDLLYQVLSARKD